MQLRFTAKLAKACIDSDVAVDQFVDALRAELKQLVDQQNRVRIR